jgi:hypothetical protein
MREDLRSNPAAREFVILKRSWVYNSHEPFVAYYSDEHENLEGKLQVLANLGLVREVTYNNVRRFVFQEDFVDYRTRLAKVRADREELALDRERREYLPAGLVRETIRER